jgi:diguanylate cyclase (GGDEF)-like protein
MHREGHSTALASRSAAPVPVLVVGQDDGVAPDGVPAGIPSAGGAEGVGAPEVERRLLRRLDAIRIVVSGALVLLAVVALGLLAGGMTPLDLLVALLTLVIGGGLFLHHRTSLAIADRRRSRETSMTRILQGLSRSLSPDSVVDAIVAELCAASGADHVVVARVRQADHVVEVTLVAASQTIPPSRTWLRPEVAELSTDRDGDASQATTPLGGTVGPAGLAVPVGAVPMTTDPARSSSPQMPRMPQMPQSEAGSIDAQPVGDAQAAADEIARRVRSAYGLPYTVAEPLIGERRFLGALILSKRTRDSWSEQDRRLLGWAALEVSAAFSRAYALEEAERDANLDALTGLPNRRYFDELLAIMRPGRRTTDSLGILMVDIDRFKTVNDRHGHGAGDGVLRAVAGAISQTIRAEDTPARYGGEEFAVILRRASAKQAVEVAERLRIAVSALSAQRLGVSDHVTVSIGVAVADPGEDIEAVIERADHALYVAKRSGRDRVEVG